MNVTVVLDNVRSLYNVGAVIRACDGAGVTRLVTCGITPYPSQGRDDPRRGPVAARADRELRKTALSSYNTVRVEHVPSLEEAVRRLQSEGATVVAVEATPTAPLLWQSETLSMEPLALVLGHEVEGLPPEALSIVDAVVRIPMLGAGKSLNVAVAASLVLYEVVRRKPPILTAASQASTPPTASQGSP